MLHKADVHFMLQKNVKVENSFFQVIHRKKTDTFSCNIRKDKNQDQQPSIVETHTPTLPNMKELEALREQVLQELKLGKQAPGYKTTQKALNQFITLLSKRL